MLPLSDPDIRRRRRPYINVTLVVLSGLVFLFELLLPEFPDRAVFFYRFGLIPAELVSGEAFQGLQTPQGVLDIATPFPTWGTLFTSMFIHGSWMHFIGNMLFLWVFGDNIESRLGHIPYLAFYLLAGVAAAFTQVFITPGSEIPTIGASGAIAGVLGGYLVLYPHSRVNTLVIFYFITVIRIPALYLLGFWILMQFVEGLGSLGLSSQTGGVAYWAHIGGFVFGAILLGVFALIAWAVGGARRRSSYR